VNFKDHFSAQASDYARFRPRYPAELFAYLAEICHERNLAWDCATGNGQAATALAEHFGHVTATDASVKQIEKAELHSRITYRVAAAEQSGLETSSCDLVTVAQALHWFDLTAFHAEVKRVLKPAGVLAVWNYTFLQITPEIDALVKHFYDEIVGPFWPPERKLVEKGYREMPFPFQEVEPPHFRMIARWSLEELLGYLRTWSATQRYMQANASDPLVPLDRDIANIWGNREIKRPVLWPLELRVGQSAP
jgi:SAM-dependent methyltransferase